jgi:hypothetical protein
LGTWSPIWDRRMGGARQASCPSYAEADYGRLYKACRHLQCSLYLKLRTRSLTSNLRYTYSRTTRWN